ncbi:MAG: hypothetical protein LCH41_01445 [Armatimonadetes bacterium]|nr:hypothetical protein [Armatimonadota bacterium]
MINPPQAVPPQAQTNYAPPKDSTHYANETLSRTASAAVGTCSGLTLFLALLFVGLPLVFCVGCSVLSRSASQSIAAQQTRAGRLQMPPDPAAAISAAERVLPGALLFYPDGTPTGTGGTRFIRITQCTFGQGNGFMERIVEASCTYSNASNRNINADAKLYALDASGKILADDSPFLGNKEAGDIAVDDFDSLLAVDDPGKVAVFALVDQSRERN